MIVLYYGTISPSKIGTGSNELPDEELANWHSERCREIVLRINEDCAFAERVRTLKVYAYSDDSNGDDDLAAEMSQLLLVYC